MFVGPGPGLYIAPLLSLSAPHFATDARSMQTRGIANAKKAKENRDASNLNRVQQGQFTQKPAADEQLNSMALKAKAKEAAYNR